MKKTFLLKSNKIAPERQVESVKHQIKKYMAREKRKSLPENFDYWSFECKIGTDETNANDIHANEIRAEIDKLVANEKESFYLEVKAVSKKFKPKDNLD